MGSRPDVLIIGGGPAGYVCAIRMAQLGRKVVVVERDRLGGVCLNWGCIPVKSLLHAAGTIRNATEARRMGISYSAPSIDLLALMSWKSRIVDRLVRGVEFLFRSNGIDLVKGEARFVDETTAAVTEPGGKVTEFTAGDVVVATGSKPAMLSEMPTDDKTVLDSNSIFRVTEIPKRLAVIGAGVIGLEFATIFSRLGSKVMVLELLDQLLPGTDAEIAGSLARTLRSEGIDVLTGVRVQGVDRDAGLRVRYGGAEGEATVEADAVFVAVGRVPLTDGLDLDRAGVRLDKQGRIEVDDKYRTSARHVYAIGDCKSGPQLAHKAMAEGIALAELAAGGKQWKFRAIPSCVYTDPEVASVGLTEAEAQKQKLPVRVSRVPLTAVGRSLTLGRSEGLCKLVVDAESDKVLGAAIVGPQADALVAEATLAVELGLTARQLGRVVHAHPTMSELLFEAAEAVHGRAVHIVNR